MVDNTYVKEAYKYDYITQLDLTTVNGLTLNTTASSSMSIHTKGSTVIANVFFRVCK